MPRHMPRYDIKLMGQSQLSLSIVAAGEAARLNGDKKLRDMWSVHKLESLYELAFLRLFAAWETCQESIFYRSLCGYASRTGQETLVTGSHFSTLAAAEAAVLAFIHSGRIRPFALWSDPNSVIRRCQHFIRTGAPGCYGVHETVISSNVSRLASFAAIRHRIAHDQSDAKNKFNNATLALVGRTYLGSRPGKFLRDWNRHTTPYRRWLDVLTTEFVGLAGQLV